MGRQIYLDFNASTPVAPEVLETMMPYMEGLVGNPSSQHWAGVPYKESLARARRQVSRFLGCHDDEIIFTSGGSESNNLALKGLFFSSSGRGKHIVTSQVEHPSVTDPCEYLRKFGAEISYVSVDSKGRVDPEDVRKAITSETALVSIMHSNNEVGTIQPLEEISKITQERGVPLHTDAAQSVGKISVNVEALGVDLLTVAGHKFHAPKGIGALYVRRGIALEALIHGADHEHGLRAGTEAVALCMGLGNACELAADLSYVESMARLRDLFKQLLWNEFGASIAFNGHETHCLPNTLSVSFVNRVGADILARVPELAASTGSACHSGQPRMSSTLLAMGLDSNVGLGTVRFSLGRTSTVDEIQYAVDLLAMAL
jgi:cysteine desulfurase